MNNNRITAKDKLVAFIKKYGYIFALAILTIVMTIIISVSVTKPQDVNEPVDNEPVSFYMPVVNATIEKGFSDTELKFNETLNQWEAHKAVDFKVADKTEVYAVLDGKVIDVQTNYLKGTTVIIEHSNNIKTVYSSLAEDVSVKKGDTVKRGALIGKASNTANSELKTGAHLHFEVLENDVAVDPANYLNIEEK